jgi:stearoyl-CoA desaturase (delta-9 desaturase)
MSIDVLEPPSVLPAPDPSPTPGELSPPHPVPYRLALTALITVAPLVVAAVLFVRWIGEPVPWFELALMVVLLSVIGHGVTIGFHRLFTHRSFEATRPVKIGLAVLGSMAFQGSVIGWVADHRRHHRYADQPGDPHSPLWIGSAPVSGWRGLLHAHMGWAYRGEATPRSAYVRDLLADRDLVVVDHLFVPLCVASLALPFGIGYLWTATLAGAVSALLVAGVVRIALSHHVTWSVNSVCHRFGRRAFRTRDASTNVAWLALPTMGESWHNNHHAFPRLARHGVDAHQLDTSAAVIRLFERLGWVSNVQWPDDEMLRARRVDDHAPETSASPG